MADNELERTLWAAADKLRNNMDAAEYKHIVLGLIFLKYISDAFSDLYLKKVKGNLKGPIRKIPMNTWPIISFLFPKKPVGNICDFNRWLEENYSVEIEEYEYPSSKVLFQMSEADYKEALRRYNADPKIALQRIEKSFPAPIAYYFYQAVNNFQNEPYVQYQPTMHHLGPNTW